MNKLYKYIIIGIALFSLGFAQANYTYADCNQKTFMDTFYLNSHSSDTSILDAGSSFCFYSSSSNFNSSNIYYDFGGQTNIPVDNNLITCVYADGGEGTLIIKNNYSSSIPITYFRNYCNSFNGVYINENNCPISSQSICESAYSLIPVSSVDSNYCESNNLCTVCNDTPGEINTGVSRSSLFLNGTQINSNAIIDIYADDRLNTEVDYLNDTVDINITQNIDTSYIEDVKNKEKLTPTNEDVEYMIQGLQVYIPYIFIGLIIIYTLYLIKKFFRG